ncbi:UDP-N-acetylglucosamine--undecaprenyl-phosphate N-acetylglucosaminephosphotransferase [Ferrimonas lipolytica]|uniref:Undecaprenyl-phosphate alpha-N-acetylglucosaminyl 1-phosphate transferase n=1 Tax=Ferrimonas lipolytica TaxID=2724191 RepID=A0A6H1UFD3_9GAMM|nr:UDP-N-acetylglucosamine--undecaprenyl-phosphate N-acetylglucosaminephosphotransferase [Ferrimonas lipolytica]QIZ77310.1 UDP-N-acetylglucosamine--undecaprenyl-phosphate N-acetylglucosaminephosphotransferase [Ferrimonas lipolytica]
MIIELTFVFLLSFSSLLVMRKVGKKIGLVDQPNARKHHVGAVPLVGGISICICITAYLLTTPNVLEHYNLYLSSIVLLTFIGALDDKFDLSFKVRLILQAGLSLCMIYFAEIELNTLGNLFGLGEVSLGIVAPLVTICAVIGAINAFNMVDGIDGLLGGLSIVTFGAIAVLLGIDKQFGLAYMCLIIVTAMLPYIFMNLGILGKERKVFMGDAGSMMIGFTVIWLLLDASQDPVAPLMRPVTALWLIAVPLTDMATIMIRRIRRGDSPFKPDREHLHHIFQRLGLSSRQTLVVICSIATAYAAFGLYGEYAKIPDIIMFILFVLSFIAYAVMMSNIWKITSAIRRWRGVPERVYE